MQELNVSPSILKDKINPARIFAGRSSSISITCALIGVANHDMKFSLDFLGSIIYPSNKGKPILNNYGKYGIKLHVNGCERLIEVDDHILIDSKSKESALCQY